jgi:hypothetical protein
MRLSVLALFIALPAAVYAGMGTVSHVQCIYDDVTPCDPPSRPCCGSAGCVPVDPSIPNEKVCFIAHFLRFAFRY